MSNFYPFVPKMRALVYALQERYLSSKYTERSFYASKISSKFVVNLKRSSQEGLGKPFQVSIQNSRSYHFVKEANIKSWHKFIHTIQNTMCIRN